MGRKLVNQKKFWEFQAEVQALALERFGVNDPTDPDEMPCVQVHLVDRSRNWPMHYSALPYTHRLKVNNRYQDLIDDPKKAELFQLMFRRANSNLAIARRDMDSLVLSMDYWFNPKKRK